MMKNSLPLFSVGLAVAGAALAQSPPPAGMTLQQYLSVARGRLLDRDSDGDGRISAAEFAAGMGAGRGRAKARDTAAPAMPTPGSDAPSPATPAGGGMAGARAFERFDTNHDGYLDKTEIDAMLTRRFERMDSNHDGILTAEEREAARGGMHGRAGADQ